MIKIKNQLVVFFVFFSMLLTLIIALFFNFALNNSFDKYLKTKNQQIIRMQDTDNKVGIKQQGINTSNRFYQLNSVETDLKQSINNYIILIGILSFIISILVAYIFSKRFTKPILRITEATNKIKKGKYDIKIEDKTRIEELSTLIKALEKMANKINENIEHDKRLSQDVQHELRTPLTNIKAQIEAMIDGVWQINELNLKLCLDEINRMNSILNQLYQLGMIEIDSQLILININMKDLVSNIVKENSIALNKKNMSVDINIQNDFVILSDENLIKSAITNLITNAIRYSGDNSKIEINIRDFDISSNEYKNMKFIKDNIDIKSNYYLIEVFDNGIGIAEDKINKIIDRFYRVDKSRSRNLGGAGLGLSIVNAVAQKLDGFLYVESEENVYSKFTIFIKK